MKIVKVCCVIVLGLYMLSGCGTSSTQSGGAGQNTSMQHQLDATQSSVAKVMGITTSIVSEKPGATRVSIMVDRKTSYSTAREGNQLVVNVFSAQLASPLQQLDLRDPVVKSFVAKQVGTSVKSIIELVNPDVAYTPSTSIDPYRILIDILPISSNAMQKDVDELQNVLADPEPIGSINQGTPVLSPSPAEERMVDVQQPLMEVPLLTEQMSSEDIPLQLQWFSEKLSQVLQERESIKQELLDVEKNVAIKDSMLEVLERKVREANNRIVELEEDLIKANSKTSLMEQSEQMMQSELQQVLVKSGAQQETGALSAIKEPLGALKHQLDMLLNEREELHKMNEMYQTEIELQKQAHTAEMDSLKNEISRLGVVEKELGAKEYELTKLQQAIGDAAKLISMPPEQPVETLTPTLSPPSLPTPTPTPMLPSTPMPTPTPIPTLTPMLSPTSISPTIQLPEISSLDIQAAEPTESDSQAMVQLQDTPKMLPEPERTPAVSIQQEPPEQQVIGLEDYVLGVGDSIRIEVVDNEELDKTVTVSSEGSITYPLLGDLQVDGLSIAQVDAQMTSLLARDLLIDPEVIVEVVEPRSKKVYIMGEVKQTGYHELQGDERLLNTLLSAGGPTSFNTEVRILRLPKQDSGGAEVVDSLAPIVTDLNALFVAGDQDQNILLEDGDVVMVALTSAKSMEGGSGETSDSGGLQQFFVVGSVVKPGIYAYKEDDTVLDAILRAGGFAEFALRNGTKVIRESSENKTNTFRIKMENVMENGNMDENIPIMPGDMIIVPENVF